VLEHVEQQVQLYVEWLRLVVEALGALTIAAGVAAVIVGLARHAAASPQGRWQQQKRNTTAVLFASDSSADSASRANVRP
jgi:hypothetical protein